MSYKLAFVASELRLEHHGRSNAMNGTDKIAVRLVEAIGRGVPIVRCGDGWAGGGVRASSETVRALERARLVERAPGGRLRLTGAGEAHCRRGNTGRGLRVERLHPDAARQDRAIRSVTMNLAESPLGWLAARGHISERQRAAGERLRADWTMAGLAPRVTMRWDHVPAGQACAEMDPTLAQIAAKRRFDAAIADLDTGLADIAWRVLCNGDGLSAAEAAMGWPKRSAKLVLGLALDRLARHYRVA